MAAVTMSLSRAPSSDFHRLFCRKRPIIALKMWGLVFQPAIMDPLREALVVDQPEDGNCLYHCLSAGSGAQRHSLTVKKTLLIRSLVHKHGSTFKVGS